MQTSPEQSRPVRNGGVGAGWEAGDAPRLWSSGGTEVTGLRRCPRGGKELFRVLRLLDHIYLPALKKKCIIIVFWPCCMACGNLETEAVSPAVDCQISPSVASLFKNIYLIFKIIFLCGFLITSWWIICSLPPATSLSLPLPGVCACVCVYLRVEELVMTMGREGSKTWARKIALVHSNLETSLSGPGNLG